MALPFLSQRYAVRASEMFDAVRGRGDPDLRRPHRPAARPADRGLRRPGRGQPGHRAPDRDRAADGRRRAGRAHHPRLRRTGDGVPGRRALRRARAPAPGPVGHRPVPGPLQRQPAGRRLRRGGEHRLGDHRGRRRGQCGQGPGGAAVGRYPAAHRAGHARRAVHSWTPATPGCASSCASRRAPGCARRCRSCCRARSRCGSTRGCCPTRRSPTGARARTRGRTAGELFADYLAQRGHVDEPTVRPVRPALRRGARMSDGVGASQGGASPEARVGRAAAESGPQAAQRPHRKTSLESAARPSECAGGTVS